MSSSSTEAASDSAEAPTQRRQGGGGTLLGYLLIGIFFGIVLTKNEVISWFRIQEMFRFQAFHMYGILGSAVVVGAGSIALIRAYSIRTLTGESIEIPSKKMGGGYRYWIGGLLFGMGWALTGACPGPLFALVGNGITVYMLAIASALVGTWMYGRLRPSLPH